MPDKRGSSNDPWRHYTRSATAVLAWSHGFDESLPYRFLEKIPAFLPSQYNYELKLTYKSTILHNIIKLIYGPLQIHEVFHLEFLRWFARKLEADRYALKGGVNLRLFFKSIRYSEDMDIDVKGARVDRIKKTVMDILETQGFSASLKSFGIEKVVPPDLTKAKQTETTQRFKIHLLTAAGEDLFTKVEFSRRGMKGYQVVEPVSSEILRAYKMAPLLVPHYDVTSAVMQKIHALAQRTVLQARDIFDLFVLSAQYEESKRNKVEVSPAILKTAHDNIFLVEFARFRDTVVAYLGAEDQKAYSSPALWDEIKLKTAHFLEAFKK